MRITAIAFTENRTAIRTIDAWWQEDIKPKARKPTVAKVPVSQEQRDTAYLAQRLGALQTGEAQR